MSGRLPHFDLRPEHCVRSAEQYYRRLLSIPSSRKVNPSLNSRGVVKEVSFLRRSSVGSSRPVAPSAGRLQRREPDRISVDGSVGHLRRLVVEQRRAQDLENRSGKYVQPTTNSILAEASALEKKTPASETLSMIDDAAPTGYPIINYEYDILPAKEPGAKLAAAVRAFL